MDISAIANLSWREVLIAISVVLAIYIVVVFLRFYGLRQRQEHESFSGNIKAADAIAAYAHGQQDEQNEFQTGSSSALDGKLTFASLGGETSTVLSKNTSAWYESPPDTKELDALDNDRTSVLEREVVIFRKDRKRILALEQEVAQFRKEVGSLRAEVMVLREVQQEIEREIEREVAQKAEREIAIQAEREAYEARREAERETQTKLARNASPFYNDAMEMAMQGHDSASISTHCGISLAEAELVVALAKDPS